MRQGARAGILELRCSRTRIRKGCSSHITPRWRLQRKAEVRIQFKAFPGSLFCDHTKIPLNELILRIQPKEAIYAKVMTKQPGLSEALQQVELDLSYQHRFKAVGSSCMRCHSS